MKEGEKTESHKQSDKNYTEIQVLKTKVEYIQSELKILIALNSAIFLTVIGMIFKGQ